MLKEIKISILDIDDDDISKFKIEATNGVTSGSLEFWGYLDHFHGFAKGLITFPKTIDDMVVHANGEESPKWHFYFYLKAFCYERNGASAIHVKINNNRNAPDSNNAEFFITTDPASINKLGQLLLGWDPNEVGQIIWSNKSEW